MNESGNLDYYWYNNRPTADDKDGGNSRLLIYSLRLTKTTTRDREREANYNWITDHQHEPSYPVETPVTRKKIINEKI